MRKCTWRWVWPGLACALCVVCAALLVWSRGVSPMSAAVRSRVLRAPESVAEAEAPVTLALSARFVNDLATLHIPQIEAQQNGMIVPAQKLSHGEVEAMQLQNYKMQAMRVTFAPQGAKNMSVEIVNMSLTIPPTNFTIKVFPLSCTGKLWSTMNETTIDFRLRLYRLPNGTLQAEVNNTAVRWGNMTFNHTLDSTTCNVAQSIVQAFMGDVNAYAVKSVKANLLEMLPRTTADNVSTALRAIPFSFVADPQVTAERVVVAFRLGPSSDEAPRHVDADLPSRDVALRVPVAAVQRYVDYLHHSEALDFWAVAPASWNSSVLADLFPAVVELCPDCPLGFRATTRDAPWARTEVRLNEDGTNQSITLHVTDWYGSLFMLARNATHAAWLRSRRNAAPHENELWVPLLLLTVNFTSAVSQLGFVGSLVDQLRYTLDPLRDLALVVLQSLVGDVQSQGLTSDIDTLMNAVVLPLLNLDSPVSLAYLVRNGTITVTDAELCAGVDVNMPYF